MIQGFFALPSMRQKGPVDLFQCWGINKVAKGMLQSGKLSYEEIAEIAELSIDEVKALDEKVIAQHENAT